MIKSLPRQDVQLSKEVNLTNCGSLQSKVIIETDLQSTKVTAKKNTFVRT